MFTAALTRATSPLPLAKAAISPSLLVVTMVNIVNMLYIVTMVNIVNMVPMV